MPFSERVPSSSPLLMLELPSVLEYLRDPFVWIPVLCMVAAIAVLGRTSRAPAIPGVLTSIGIAGTFFGILVALQPFALEGQGLQEGVEALLRGIGIAMATSFAGVCLAVLARLFPSVSPPARDPAAPIVWAIRDHAKPLQALIAQGEASSALAEAQHALLAALVDRQDRALELLTTQTETAQAVAYTTAKHQKRLEEGVRQMSDRLDDALDRFAAQSTEAIVEALRSIVDGYNTHVQEQLGEAFDALRESADHLSTWQRAHLEEVRAAHSSIEQAGALAHKLERAAAHHTDLVGRSDEALDRLRTSVEAVGGLVDEVAGALPDLQDRAEAAVDGVARALSAHGDRVVEQAEATADRVHAAVDALAEGVRTQTAEQAEAMTEAARTAGTAIEEAVGRLHEVPDLHRERVEELLAGYGSGLERAAEAALDGVGVRLADAVDRHLAEVRPAQDRVVGTFEKLHLLMGHLEDGVATYQREITKNTQALQTSGAQLRNGLDDQVAGSLRLISDSLARIHGHYADQLDDLRARVGPDGGGRGRLRRATA